jgi:O-methyltransferase involved in polyketide biosynthesis
MSQDRRWDIRTGPGITRSTSYTGVRTRYFDDFLSAACRAGCAQVAILAV